MDNYTFNGRDYIANDGYQFTNKSNGYTSVIMRLAPTDSIDNYTVEPIPPEPVELEENKFDYETAYNELQEVIENA